VRRVDEPRRRTSIAISTAWLTITPVSTQAQVQSNLARQRHNFSLCGISASRPTVFDFSITKYICNRKLEHKSPPAISALTRGWAGATRQL
jgi:hypothetical protein